MALNRDSKTTETNKNQAATPSPLSWGTLLNRDGSPVRSPSPKVWWWTVR